MSESPAVPGRSPGLAAFLSFLWPGLGELYVRRLGRAAFFALPVLAVAAFVAWQALGGLDLFAVQLIEPRVAAALVGLVVVLGVWRLLSVGGAFLAARGARRATPGAKAILGILLVAVVGTHAVAGYYALAFYNAGSTIFGGGDGTTADPGTSAEPGTSGSPAASAPGSPRPVPTGNAADFQASPDATPPSSSARVNILVTGIDSGHDRNHALTDTLLVVSVDPASKTAVMLSMPRDVSNFRLYNGGTFTGKINSLMSYARTHPDRFPDGPVGTLTKELGFLLGIRIHYYAAINLEGFEKMVDIVGGVDVDNPKRIADPNYDWFNGTYGFNLSPGVHHLDGRHALAYARSRMGIGDNDFTRARRQQQLLVALAKKMAQPSALLKLPDLLDAASKTIRTNFPADRIREFLALAKQIPEGSIKRYVLGPPYAVHPPTDQTGGVYTLVLQMNRIKALSVKLFGEDSAYSK